MHIFVITVGYIHNFVIDCVYKALIFNCVQFVFLRNGIRRQNYSLKIAASPVTHLGPGVCINKLLACS